MGRLIEGKQLANPLEYSGSLIVTGSGYFTEHVYATASYALTASYASNAGNTTGGSGQSVSFNVTQSSHGFSPAASPAPSLYYP